MGYPSYDHLVMRPVLERSERRLTRLREEMRNSPEAVRNLWPSDVMEIILDIRAALE